MLEMKPEIRKDWCAALRSDKYPQARSFLRHIATNGLVIGYCCLGVLTDRYVKAGNPEWYDAPAYSGGTMRASVWDTSGLAEPVRVWAGLENEDPALSDGEIAITHNDIRESSFGWIADLIDDGEGKPSV